MRAALAIAPLLLAACGTGGDSVSKASGKVVADTFLGAIDACTAAPPASSAIAEAGLTAKGWSATEREIVRDAERRKVAPGKPGELREGEIETSTWRQGESPGKLYVTRGAGLGNCMLDLRPEGEAGVREVSAAIERRFGRLADRSGVRPQGGDFLTPRKQEETRSSYWRMPLHDVYLERFESGAMRIEIVAMPDRTAIAETSPDSPNSRIYVQGSN